MSEYQDSIADIYRALMPEVNKFVDLKGKKVLDFGSGGGTVYLSSLGIDIVGVDNNQPGWDYIKEAENYAKERSSLATFENQNGESLEFNDESFDAVLAIDVMEHLKNPVKVLNEIRRILKLEGYLIIIWSPYYGPFQGHLRYYSKNPWRQLMPFFNAEKYLSNACKRNTIIPYENALAVQNSLNKLTLRKFRRMLPETGLTLEILHKRPFMENAEMTGLVVEKYFRMILNKVPLVPFLEEFITQSVLVVLRKE